MEENHYEEYVIYHSTALSKKNEKQLKDKRPNQGIVMNENGFKSLLSVPLLPPSPVMCQGVVTEVDEHKVAMAKALNQTFFKQTCNTVLS